MAKPADTAILQVTESFISGATTFRKGDLVDADHPVVKTHRQFLGPVKVQHQAPHKSPDVEQATAAPGEKRGR